MSKKFIFLIFLILTTYSSFAQKEQGLKEIINVEKVAPLLNKSVEKSQASPKISKSLHKTSKDKPKDTASIKTLNITQTSNPKKSTTKTLAKKTVSQNTKKEIEEEKEGKEQKDIYLNFENTELSNFINYIAELKKINLIPHKTLEGVKVSLTIREPLTIDGAWNVFLTVLEMAGFSIIKIGNVDVVMPKADKYKQPLPAFINVPINTLPSSDINIRYVTFLENINVTSIQELLKSMLEASDIIIPYQEVNGLIITGKSYNIKSAMKVIQSLDQTGLQESVVVIKLKNINAKDAKELFTSIIKPEERTSQLARLLGRQAETTLQYFSPTTRIIAEERSNSLILLGNKNSIEKIEDFIVNNLDKELKEVTSPLHIYELQHTDAEQIKTILEKVTDVSAMGEEAKKYGAVRGGVKYFKAMKFEVDKDGNRLIVSSSDKQDWSLLERTIEDLDKAQPQVALECLFVTVDASNNKSLGGAIRNKKSGQIGKHINFQSPTEEGAIVKDTSPQDLLGNMLNAVTGGLGSSIITFGPSPNNIWGVFKALQTHTNTNILSQPFLSVANKTKGHIEFGSKINVVNEETAGIFKGYKEVEATTKLDLTPQINADGVIRLTIAIDIDEFTNEELGNKSIKKVTTDVTVADGQVIALGGFVKSKIVENLNKTPILGDIPILGWLFKHKSKNLSKNYIFMFISPTIIKPRKTPGTNLYSRMKLHQAKSDIDNSSGLKDTRDPIHNWFFNSKGKEYSNKIVDFANAKYQPTTVDIKNDPYYRTHTERTDDEEFNTTPTKKNLKIKKQNKTKLLAKTKIENSKEILNTPIIGKNSLKETLNNNINFKKLKINNPYKRTRNKSSNQSIKSLKKLKRRRQT